MVRERRVFSLDRVELRAAEDDSGSPGNFFGHAAVFNTPVRIWDWYEQVAPTAFDRALNGEDDVRLLFNHNADHVLARSKYGEGTLTLSKDDNGLVAEASLPDTTMGRDLAVMLERRDVDQMSFGFRTIKDSWEERDIETVDGETITVQMRTLEEVELFDVSPVTFPAYPSTDAELNSLQRTLRYLGVEQAPELVSPPATAAVTNGQHVIEVALRANTEDFDREIARINATLEELRAGRANEDEQRVGKVLSAKNRQLVKDAIAQGESALAALRALLEAAGDEDDEEDDEETNSARVVSLDPRRRRLALLEFDNSAAL
jgi:HK97 family phage prohead protease